MFKAVCKLGLEGIVLQKLDALYKSGPSKAWLKVKNPKAPAATPRYRWGVLIVSNDTESCGGPQTHTDCKIG
jgi:hypothetical protein